MPFFLTFPNLFVLCCCWLSSLKTGIHQNNAVWNWRTSFRWTDFWRWIVNNSTALQSMTVYWNLVWLLYTVKTCKSSSWPNWWLSNVGRARISSLQHGSYFAKTWGWGFSRNENRPRLIMEQTYVKIEQLQLISWWTAAKLYNISCQICWSDQISSLNTHHTTLSPDTYCTFC